MCRRISSLRRWTRTELGRDLTGVLGEVLSESELSGVPPASSLRDYVQYWAERGVEVVGWTVNTAVEKDYYHTLLKSGYSTDSLLEDCSNDY